MCILFFIRWHCFCVANIPQRKKMCVFFFLSASVFLFHFLKIHYKCTRNVRRVNHKVITYLLKIENKINKLRSNFKERKSKCDLPVLWIGCNQHCFTWHNSPFRLVFFWSYINTHADAYTQKKINKIKRYHHAMWWKRTCSL